MANYLYLLPFKGVPHFKFGISTTDNFERIKHLSGFYPVDLDNSLIIKSKNIRLIKTLEQQIKVEYSKYSVPDYVGKDGATEILSDICLHDVVQEIQRKVQKGLDLKINKGVKLEPKQVISATDKSPKKKKVKRDMVTNLDEWFIFYHRLNRYANHIEKLGIIDGTLYIRCTYEWYKNLVCFDYLDENGEPISYRKGKRNEKCYNISIDVETPRSWGFFGIFQDAEPYAVNPQQVISDWKGRFTDIIKYVTSPSERLYGSKAASDILEYLNCLFDMIKEHPKYDPNFTVVYPELEYLE